MKYKLSVVRRSGKIVENPEKRMNFFALEVALALDMLRKGTIKKVTVEITRGYAKQYKPHNCIGFGKYYGMNDDCIEGCQFKKECKKQCEDKKNENRKIL